MDAAELKKLVKDLNTASTSGKPEDAVVILRRLKSSIKATEELLRETRAGVAVGKLRTHASKEVSDLAKELVRKWKGEVDAIKKAKGAAGPADANGVKKEGKPAPSISTNLVKKEKTTSAGSTQSPATPAAALPSATPSKTQHTSLPPKPTATGASQSRNTKTDGVKVKPLGDKTRDACLVLVYDALASDSNAPAELIMSRAVAIEQTVFVEFNNQSGALYKTKMRRLYLNLKEKTNPELRRDILEGELSTGKFCTMSNAEMASQERRQADALLYAQNMHASLGAGEQEAETDAFKCGRCGQRKTRYRQAQTRSADEPMTTFVTCVNCNNRWKFC